VSITANICEVLLVEDNPAHAELIKRRFGERYPNIHLRHVTDGQQALDLLLQQNQSLDLSSKYQPACILLDIRLPKISGLEVLRQLRNSGEFTKTPIVILSSSAANQDLESAYKHCANSYLVKPTNLSDFFELIDAIGNYWLDWNQAVSN